MTLVPQVTLQAFEKWAMDFIGLINPLAKRSSARYIITMEDYLTRWDEVQPVKDCNSVKTTQFLFEHVITRF